MPQRQLTTYQAVIAQARAFRSLRVFMAQILKDHNLTMTEWLIIGTVIDHTPKGVRVSELANALGVEMPVVTNLVHKATSKGWLQNVADEKDKRAKRIVATTKGMEDACDIEGVLTEQTKQWLSGLSQNTINGYFEVVGALSKK